MKVISIAKDYSPTPIGRFPEDSNYSGAAFRENVLRKALTDGQVIVDLDGVEGLGSSFLEESFGGLVRKNYFTADQLHKRLKVQCTEPRLRKYVKVIWEHIDGAHVEAQ